MACARALSLAYIDASRAWFAHSRSCPRCYRAADESEVCETGMRLLGAAADAQVAVPRLDLDMPGGPPPGRARRLLG